jgi:hypothetical protein
MLGQGQVGIRLQLFGEPLPQSFAFTEGLPGILWIVTSPVRRLLLSQRLMVERETPKSSETSFLGMPRSIEESTFSLRSFEYAFMDLFLCRSAIYASRCENAETKRRSGFYTRLSDDDVTRTDEMTSLVGLSRLVNAFLHWCASASMRSAHQAMRRTRTSATIPEQAHSKQYHPKSGVVRPTPQTQAA